MKTPCVKHFNRLKSTNTYVLDNFSELDMGDVVTTDIQTGGRGRFDRTWQGMASDNIYMSFVIKPENIDSFPCVNLTQYLSVVFNRILNKKYAIMSYIKWPNDILFEGKKLSGILAETKLNGNKLEGVVLGIGINVNNAPSEIVPNSISVSDILGRKVDKNELMTLVINEFFKDFEKFEQDGFKYIFEEYSQMCKFKEEIKIGNSYKEGEFENYKFERLNEDGTLTVSELGEKGCKEIKIVSGDILC